MTSTVIIKKLDADHGVTSFTTFRPLQPPMVQEIRRCVGHIFDELGGASLLKSSGEVYIKPNAVDAKAYSHTRVEVLSAVIDYFREKGAKKIYLFENATQANYTRLVFRATGYRKLCREKGVIPIYLDEEKSTPLPFNEPGSQSTGYDLPVFHMPETVMALIRERDAHLYINVPKLKTHSMGVVTLGVKNQWGFPMHGSRGKDHNHLLHHKLVDILRYIRPDVTLIEGVEGTIHGHYFPTALADEQVRPFKVLVAGTNVVATDIVGARLFGLDVNQVPHLKLAVERKLSEGVASLDDIHLSGDLTDLTQVNLAGDMPATGHYPWDLFHRFPADVAVLKGREKACPEGCVNNPLCTLQTIHLDHGGKGGFTLIMGKGHDASALNAIQGKTLIAGPCAIKETADRLIHRLGRENVYLSRECNNLCDTVQALFHLMKVNPAFYVPVNPLLAGWDMLMAKAHGSTSRVPHPFCHLFKMV